MTTTVSEIRVWAGTMTTDRELLEYACKEAVNAGGSFSIEYLGTGQLYDAALYDQLARLRQKGKINVSRLECNGGVEYTLRQKDLHHVLPRRSNINV